MNVADEFGPLVREMLDEFGADGLLMRGPTYDPATDRMVPGWSDPRVARMVLAPVEHRDRATGTVERRTLATMIMEPRRGDTIEFGGTTYTVGDVTANAPQGVAISYVAEVSS